METKLNELVADGELDKGDERDLIYLSAQLGLKHEDLEELEKKRFLDEFVPIKQRIERTWQVSDVDLQDIERLEKKYDTRLTMSGENQIFRAIYLIESKGQLPPPVPTALMLNGNETAYYSLPSIWHQTRVRTRGYSGVSIGIPTGIKGVRFRFGGYSPIRSEELTSLSDGQLCITSKRVLFNGEIRSTTIDLKRVVDCEVFSDALKVEKSTGKPDYFSMSAAQARYITALIGALK